MSDSAEARRRERITYSEPLAEEIIVRVACGESVTGICREAGMPHRTTVQAWMDQRPEFEMGMAEARAHARLIARRRDLARVARPRDPRGLWSTYTPETGAAVCDRLMDGWTLDEIAREPWAPCRATILNWARRVPEFADAYARARMLAMHELVDLSLEAARAATPESVAEARAQLRALRARGARIAARKYLEPVKDVAPSQAVPAA